MEFLRWYRQHWDRTDTIIAVALVLAVFFRLYTLFLK